jgi:hypothetical protein
MFTPQNFYKNKGVLPKWGYLYLGLNQVNAICILIHCELLTSVNYSGSGPSNKQLSKNTSVFVCI